MTRPLAAALLLTGCTAELPPLPTQVYYLYATEPSFCPACRELAPQLDALTPARRLTRPEYRAHGVTSVPTVIVMSVDQRWTGGAEVRRGLGIATLPERLLAREPT